MTKGNDGWKDLDLYQNISACPQEPVFLEGLTIREHIEYIEKLTDCHMSLDNYVEKLHLNELMDMYPSQLSGGEQKRAAFLLCIAKDVDIYILDEPTTGLHFADVHKLIEILQRLSEGGNTVVVIEHNLDVIKTADYIIDMGPEGGDGGGTVIAKGTPEEVAKVKGSYTGQYVKKYLKK